MYSWRFGSPLAVKSERRAGAVPSANPLYRLKGPIVPLSPDTFQLSTDTRAERRRRGDVLVDRGASIRSNGLISSRCDERSLVISASFPAHSFELHGGTSRA